MEILDLNSKNEKQSLDRYNNNLEWEGEGVTEI